MGAFQRFFLVAAWMEQRGQLIEGEHDVRTQFMLNAHGNFGRETVFRTVDVAAKNHAVIVNNCSGCLDCLLIELGILEIRVARKLRREDLLESGSQGKDLESARIRIGRTCPVHKRTQAPGLVNDIRTWLEVEVVGVGKDRLGAEASHHFWDKRLNIRLRPHWNKRGRGNRAVCSVKGSGTAKT